MKASVIAARPAKFDLEWPQGDTVEFTVSFENESDQTPRDLSGFTTLLAQIHRQTSHGTGWSFDVDDTDKATGVIRLTTPTDNDLPVSGTWDLRGVDGNGGIETLAIGKVIVIRTTTDTASP